jgi:hypothetical protein
VTFRAEPAPRVILDDRVNPPVAFNAEQSWQCNRSRLATP